MPSRHAFKKLSRAGIDLISYDAGRYNLYDSLSTSEDLALLFEILTSVRTINGNPAVFTPVTIVANPAFDKIRDSGFKEYYFEPFTTTLNRYKGCDDSFTLWLTGIEDKIFMPQMHGREHLNVAAWMNALQLGDNEALLAFNEGLWGFVPDKAKWPDIDYQAAFLLRDLRELEGQKLILKEGLDLFEKLFGYRASYFVPPNGPFNNSLNETLSQNGIRFRSASKIQHEPLGFGKSRRVFHYLGQKDKNGIRYITRNCFFEPSQPGKDWVDSCLNDIKIAFRWNKPAIISTHRVNYTGSLIKSNRDRGLTGLHELIKSILHYWPQAEFLTTTELGNLLSGRDADE